MATLRELKKRLGSVKTTGQLAGAMKTVSSAKFSKISSLSANFKKYSAVCDVVSKNGSSYGVNPSPDAPEERKAFVVLSGNRGLCGGYNAELFSLLASELKECEIPYHIIPCGKTAVNYCKEKKIPVLHEFVFPDIPSSDDSRALSDYISEIWEKGSVTEVVFIYQRQVNTLTRIPEVIKILPADPPEEFAEVETLFIPDKKTVDGILSKFAFETKIRSLVLECASGVQAATLLAMRSASDNAEKTTLALETEINRKRQSDVTSSVIETSPIIEEN